MLSFLRRRSVVVTAVLLLLAVVFGCWLGVRAFDAKSNLEQARVSAQLARDALLGGNAADALRYADDAHSHAEASRAATHSLPWNIAAVVPWLGSPFKTGQQLTDVVYGLATDVLQPSAAAGGALSPDRLLQGNRVDVDLLRSEEPKLSRIAAAATRLHADASAISKPLYFSILSEARAELQSQTSDVAKLLENTALAARIAPPMMGADGPRTYFMGFQTNAEARGTGGLLGGFGILRFDNGTATVDTLGSNRELLGPYAPIDLGPQFDQEYGNSNATTDFRNSNSSSHFPYAGQIWKSMWAQETGVNVDGAVAIDPIALSYILGAVGSVTLPDGEVVTKDNVVELTESTSYSRFPTDKIARKNYLQDISNAVVEKMTAGVDSPRKLLDALGKAVSERRIAVWSAWPEEQTLLEETPLAHAVPDDSAPYAEIVINNLAGNKMDYYLKREIEYVADGCEGDRRMSTVTVRLTNTVPDSVISTLPDYVAGTGGLDPALPLTFPKGTMVSSVRLLATKGAEVVSLLSNGERGSFFEATERGRPGFEVQVAIPPGKSGELSFRLSEPTSPGAPRVPIQPLVDNPVPVVSVAECTG
ncbi:MAG: DUF4012 domain-containing protein [Actinomycetia bacterium]|nr:DUF4012 domain-containing protein [Actinomycetes bacterium]